MVPNIDNEEDKVDVLNVSTFNKFETLQENFEIARNLIQMKESNSQTDSFECQVCKENFSTRSRLADHIAVNHKETKDSFTETSNTYSISRFQQTETNESFMDYNCFYCDSLITSEHVLSDHAAKCIGWNIRNTLPKSQTKIVNNHNRLEASEWNEIKLMLASMQTPKVPCDICHQEFESDSFVQLHKMCDHGKKAGIFL